MPPPQSFARLTALSILANITVRLIHNSYTLWQQRETMDQWLLEAPEDAAFDQGGFVIDSSYTRDPHSSRFSEEEIPKMGGIRMQKTTKARRASFDKRSEEVVQILTRFHNEVRMTGAEFAVMIIPDVYSGGRVATKSDP